MPGWTQSEKERRDRARAGDTVVANLRLDTNLIEWAKRQGLLIRICRGTRWGNPYKIGPDGDRATVLQNYRLHLARNSDLQKQVGKLRGKVLACWCHPEPCHGNELIRLIEGGNDEHDAP